MTDFKQVYKNLNPEQQKAVDHIDGPLLVLAGPGTGKTQLLSARVASILTKTDTAPQNILCLTFTESGAANMRERLTQFIGDAAYDVTISTYHALGGDLIKRFPEYFARTRLENPVDELGKREIISSIVSEMSYSNPLKQTQHHLGDLISTISEVKRGLLDEKSLKTIALENASFINDASHEIGMIFDTFTTMPRKLDDAKSYFENTLKALQKIKKTQRDQQKYLPLRSIAVAELEKALADAAASAKTTPLTEWKNQWLAKDRQNRFILAGELQNKRIESLADVFVKYQSALESRGLYDFDDMILRSIQALNEYPDLKFTLQEHYLYVLLDEFQDTNSAQFELVRLLSDNPVHESRPNIMAVGDDDQAIYAFQGAHYSNMVDFYKQYRDVDVINLTRNYRSHADILHTAHNIAEQIEARLHHNFKNLSKVLTAANQTLPVKSEIARHEFSSDIAEYDWIARNIANKIQSGVDPNEIAVLAPRHKYLEPLVAYLNHYGIPVNYEKRENILDSPTTKMLIRMSQLVEVLADHDEKGAGVLWPEILSYEFWELPIDDIWKISWQINDSKDETTWTNIVLDNANTKPIAQLFISLASKFKLDTAESMLDYLIGSVPLRITEKDKGIVVLQSAFRRYYTSEKYQKESTEIFYEVLSHLSVIRAKLREYQASREGTLLLRDFLDFIRLYEMSETRMIHSSPYKQASKAVQLMTVFKAKGLEFEYVYLPACIDEVWGESSRGNTNKLSLPPNLANIRHIGANSDERLRIFFVAITRAKCGLYLTSYANTFAGKATKRLKYLHEHTEDGSTYKTMAFPKHAQQNTQLDHRAPSVEAILNSWKQRHTGSINAASLRSLLHARLMRYQISPTHFNKFFDLVYGGPETFFFDCILRFPTAPTATSQYGNAIHETLQWIQQETNRNNSIPSTASVVEYFKLRLNNKKLNKQDTNLLEERGENALKAFLESRSLIYQSDNVAEHNFHNEGVLVKDTHLTGKIDLLEINKKEKTIVVVDYKTGPSHSKWASDLRLHKYKQQLYIYKILVEGSHSYKGYQVSGGRLEFIEPTSDGKIQTLELMFDDKETERIKSLLESMWHNVKSLKFPNISAYPATLTGIKQFEADIISS